jgi:hypothetical protein
MFTEDLRADSVKLADTVRAMLAVKGEALRIRAAVEAAIKQHAGAREERSRDRRELADRTAATAVPIDPLEPFGDNSGDSHDYSQWKRAIPQPTQRAVLACLLAGWHDADDGQSGVLLTRLFPGEVDIVAAVGDRKLRRITAAVGDRVLRERFHEQGRKLTLSQVSALVDELGWRASGQATPDDDEYRAARWFTGKIAPRLRQAAKPSRKSKRVRTQTIDGVVCYSVTDVRRWWPEAVP